MTGLPRWARWTIYVTVALLVVVGVAVWRISTLGAQELARMGKELDQLREVVEAVDGRRAVLVGTKTPGDAWDHYAKALELVSRADGDAHRDEILELVAKGTRCENGQFPYDWKRPVETDAPDVQVSQNLVRLVRAKADEARKAGKPREAADWLLRACQFSVDIGHNATLVSELVSSLVLCRTLVDVAALAKELDSAELARLAGKLEALERILPTWSRAQYNYALYAGVSIHSVASAGRALDELPAMMWFAGWRYSFSPGLMATDAWREMRAVGNLVATTGGRPWHEVRAELTARQDVIRNSPNLLLKLVASRTTQGTEAVRLSLAMLRLLRAGVAYWSTGERRELGDPFGTTLQWSKAPEPSRVWSLGPDGIDGGGSGSFSSNETTDLVLDLSRE